MRSCPMTLDKRAGGDPLPTRRATWLGGLVAAALWLTPAGARAEDAPAPYPECTTQPTESDVAGAKGAFQAGQASFNEADYERAVTYWEDAYRRDCTAHALLLNLARAYELNGQKRHAVNALETYLARNPNTPQRDQIARRIEVLNEKIAADTSGATSPGTPAPNGSSTSPVTSPQPPSDGTPPDTSGGSRPILPLIVAGAGGAIAIVGGILYFGAKSDESEAEDRCGGSRTNCQDPQALQDGQDARSRANVFGATMWAGVAIGIGGGVWYFLSEPEGGQQARPLPAPKHPRVAPAVAPGYAGLSLSGAF